MKTEIVYKSVKSSLKQNIWLLFISKIAHFMSQYMFCYIFVIFMLLCETVNVKIHG